MIGRTAISGKMNFYGEKQFLNGVPQRPCHQLPPKRASKQKARDFVAGL